MAQRDFLLLRDMTIMMLWIGFMYVFLSWYIKRPLSCKLITVFIIEFMLMWIGARVKGNRFAYNVIAKDFAKYYNEHNSKSLISWISILYDVTLACVGVNSYCMLWIVQVLILKTFSLWFIKKTLKKRSISKNKCIAINL